MDARPPVFRSLPTVEDIADTTEPGVYEVTLREPGCPATSARFRVDDRDGIRLASPDWDVFWRWPGDAASERAVVRQVFEHHDNRRGC